MSNIRCRDCFGYLLDVEAATGALSCVPCQAERKKKADHAALIAECDELREALRAIVTQTAPVMIAALGFAKCPICQFSEGRCAPLCPARIAREALSRPEATQPAPAHDADACDGCGHPWDWHEGDGEKGDPLECIPPSGDYCPCLDYAQPAPVRDAGVKEEP